MSELNADVIELFVDEILNENKFENLDKYLDESLIWHSGYYGEIHGINEYKNMMLNAGKVLKNMHHTIEEIYSCCNDKVVVRFTHKATNCGPFLKHPNSGKNIGWLGICIYTLKDYKITEAWFVEDTFSMMATMQNFKSPN